MRSFENPQNANEQNESPITPENLLLLRNQMQFALAFSDIDGVTSEAEERAIINKRLKKNSPNFSIVFEHMMKDNPNLFKNWQEDSEVVVNDLKQEMFKLQREQFDSEQNKSA